MSVLIQTSFGDIVIDLFIHKAPNACLNFIKLCKIKHYNNSLFWEVQKNYVTKIKSRKPTTIWTQTGKDVNFFKDQIDVQAKINQFGLVATANLGSNQNNSQFFITLTKSYLPSLSAKHTVFGKVQQGLQILKKINDTYVDQQYRPQMNIRILHTFIIDDPFPDLQKMKINRSPSPIRNSDRLQAIQHLQMLEKCKTQAQILQQTKKQKAKKQAMTLQMLGDLPDANLKPPQNVLFVCKLNPITQQRDLQVIFSRFGPIKSVQITRDWKTGQSLQYGFIQFENISSCQQAYLKMNNVLIDDRRIQVDFSQSVSKLFNRSKNAMNSSKQRFNNQPQKRRQLVPKSYTQGKDNSTKYDLVINKLPKKQQPSHYNQQKSRKYDRYERQQNDRYSRQNKYQRQKINNKSIRDRSYSSEHNHKKQKKHRSRSSSSNRNIKQNKHKKYVQQSRYK